MTSRLIAHMVMRNEASRYLAPCLRWLRLCTDSIHVFDDDSTDDSLDVAWMHGCEVGKRPPGTPGFTRNEGKFREAAWRAMEEALDPRPGDHVICVDADEFPVASGPERVVLDRYIDQATAEDRQGVIIPVAEVFGKDDSGQLLVREDGWWPSISGCRLVRYEPGGTFEPRVQGGGSVPTYVQRRMMAERDLYILHMGYARKEDRLAKYQRYSITAGHNQTHVRSIMEKPMLSVWQGKVPAGV